MPKVKSYKGKSMNVKKGYPKPATKARRDKRHSYKTK